MRYMIIDRTRTYHPRAPKGTAANYWTGDIEQRLTKPAESIEAHLNNVIQMLAVDPADLVPTPTGELWSLLESVLGRLRAIDYALRDQFKHQAQLRAEANVTPDPIDLPF